MLKRIAKELAILRSSIRSFYLFLLNIYRVSQPIILVSHNANEGGGAPVVLSEVALMLKHKYNKNVIFLSKIDGPLLEYLNKSDIYSYSYGRLFRLFSNIIRKSRPEMYLVNTIVCHKEIDYLQNRESCRLVWWIHEGDDLFSLLENKLPLMISQNVEIKAVSSLSKKLIEKKYPDRNVSLMHYYLQDKFKGFEQCNKKNRLIVSCIGQIVERKNQEALLDAWRILPDSAKDNMELHIVGKIVDDAYYKRIKGKLNGNVRHISSIERSKMEEYYHDIDYVICPSTVDPLPVVVSEGFMYGKICICSKNIGQADLVQDGVNGFLFDPYSKESIANAIMKAYEHTNTFVIQNNARDIYVSNFSLHSFVCKLFGENI